MIKHFRESLVWTRTVLEAQHMLHLDLSVEPLERTYRVYVEEL